MVSSDIACCDDSSTLGESERCDSDCNSSFRINSHVLDSHFFFFFFLIQFAISNKKQINISSN